MRKVVAVLVVAMGMYAGRPTPAGAQAQVASASTTVHAVSAGAEQAPVQGAQPVQRDSCGDGSCSPPEDCHSCPRDCGSCCGNRRCEPPEDCNSCPGDCGRCSR